MGCAFSSLIGNPQFYPNRTPIPSAASRQRGRPESYIPPASATKNSQLQRRRIHKLGTSSTPPSNATKNSQVQRRQIHKLCNSSFGIFLSHLPALKFANKPPQTRPKTPELIGKGYTSWEIPPWAILCEAWPANLGASVRPIFPPCLNWLMTYGLAANVPPCSWHA